MTKKEFELFDAINRDRLDNSDWMVYRPLVNCGSTECSSITGKSPSFLLKEGIPYLFIWLKHDKLYPLVKVMVGKYPCDFYVYLPKLRTHAYIYKLS